MKYINSIPGNIALKYKRREILHCNAARKYLEVSMPFYLFTSSSMIIFFSFWPTQINPSPEIMNWAVVVTGGVSLFSVAYYVAFARKSYTGPIVEIDPQVM